MIEAHFTKAAISIYKDLAKSFPEIDERKAEKVGILISLDAAIHRGYSDGYTDCANGEKRRITIAQFVKTTNERSKAMKAELKRRKNERHD